jgi:hypothetical protein
MLSSTLIERKRLQGQIKLWNRKNWGTLIIVSMKKKRAAVISSLALLLMGGFFFSLKRSPETSCSCVLQGCYLEEIACQMTSTQARCYETTQIVLNTRSNTTKFLVRSHKDRATALAHLSSCRERAGLCMKCMKEPGQLVAADIDPESRMMLLILSLFLFVGFLRWKFPDMFRGEARTEQPGEQLPAYDPPPPYRPAMKSVSPPSDEERCSAP